MADGPATSTRSISSEESDRVPPWAEPPAGGWRHGRGTTRTGFDGRRHGREDLVERDIVSHYISPLGTPRLGVSRTLSRVGHPSGGLSDGRFDRAPVLSLHRPSHPLSSMVAGQEQEPLHRTYAPNQRIPFEFVKHLGDGGEGSVDAVEQCSNGQRQTYARKLFKLREDDSRSKDRILNEVQIIRRLRHVHIVSVVSSYEQQSSNSYIQSFGIIMEPVADCDLGKLLRAVDNSEMPEPCLGLIKSKLRGWCICLINALAYIHNQGVRHKDIKPANILVRRDRIYVTDFGLAKDVVGLDTTEKEGHTTKTPKYCAPEVATGEWRSPAAADMFSLGCVLTEIVTILFGESLSEFNDYRMTRGTSAYHANLEKTLRWLLLLLSGLDEKWQRITRSRFPNPLWLSPTCPRYSNDMADDYVLLDWCFNTLQKESALRTPATELRRQAAHFDSSLTCECRGEPPAEGVRGYPSTILRLSNIDRFDALNPDIPVSWDRFNSLYWGR